MIHGVILAGGNSSRMGTSKTWIKLNSEEEPQQEKTMIERAVETIQEFVDKTIVVCRADDLAELEKLLKDHSVELILDDSKYRGCGPLAGIHSAMQTYCADYYFVIAVDMPNIDASYLTHLLERASQEPGFDAYCALEGERLQPLAAIYSRLHNQIETLLTNGKRSFHSLLTSVRLKTYGESEWRKWTSMKDPFFNMNTPDDMIKWKSEH